MRWRRHDVPAAPADEDAATPSTETRRAKEAARKAAIELATVRARTPAADRTGRELDDLNQHNGFYLVIRQAMGS